MWKNLQINWRINKSPQTVKYKGRDMIINWSCSEQYKHIMRSGIYNGQYLAFFDDEKNYLLNCKN